MNNIHVTVSRILQRVVRYFNLRAKDRAFLSDTG